ncbi:hypothetical protein FQR65_LT02588 [Abscondita terminalis]|nr:hypothetical protein FQR65_LT02588 [Abscondita terminalis]
MMRWLYLFSLVCAIYVRTTNGDDVYGSCYRSVWDAMSCSKVDSLEEIDRLIDENIAKTNITFEDAPGIEITYSNISVLQIYKLKIAPYLKSVSVLQTEIQTIPEDAFSKLPLLNDLNLDGESVKHFDAKSIQVGTLQKLSLSKFNLTDLQHEIFTNLNDLLN